MKLLPISGYQKARHTVSKNLTKHDGVFQVEVKQNDHLAVAWLEEGVLDVVVHDVDLVAPDAGVAEPVGVGLQHP